MLWPGNGNTNKLTGSKPTQGSCGGLCAAGGYGKNGKIKNGKIGGKRENGNINMEKTEKYGKAEK